MKDAFPILGEPESDVVHCAICGDPIADDQPSTLYHVRRDEAAHLAHTKCSAADLARIVDAIGRFGTGRLGRALRLDR